MGSYLWPRVAVACGLFHRRTRPGMQQERVVCSEIPELFLFTGRDARSVLRRGCVL